jgi:alpha-glucosidase (family GH31 glycosyl hydrolase)
MSRCYHDLRRRYAELHAEFAPALLRLTGEAARTGEPIIRPVFWLAPREETALVCDNEYLAGAEWLVAPVVHPGQAARDSYLPPGLWRDHWTGNLLVGGAVMEAYPAPLERRPLFERLPDSA